MTPERLKEVATFYHEWITHEGDGEFVPRNHCDVKAPGGLEVYEHLLGSCGEIILLADEMKLQAAARLLGMVQGVLWANGQFTLTEMKLHNAGKIPVVDHTPIHRKLRKR